jgi:hypothetical protein
VGDSIDENGGQHSQRLARCIGNHPAWVRFHPTAAGKSTALENTMLDYATAGGDVTSGDENCNVTVSVNQTIKEKIVYKKFEKQKALFLEAKIQGKSLFQTERITPLTPEAIQ